MPLTNQIPISLNLDYAIALSLYLVTKLSKFQSLNFVYSYVKLLFNGNLIVYVCGGEILLLIIFLYRKDRPSRGEGVLIAVRDLFFSSFIPSSPNLEIIFIKIGQGYNLAICCVYM